MEKWLRYEGGQPKNRLQARAYFMEDLFIIGYLRLKMIPDQLKRSVNSSSIGQFCLKIILGQFTLKISNSGSQYGQRVNSDSQWTWVNFAS